MIKPIETAEIKHLGHYQAAFEQFRKQRDASLPEWLIAHQREAFEAFNTTAFPTTKLEEWKYTSCAVIEKIAFSPVPDDMSVELAEEEVKWASYKTQAWRRVVLANGRFQPGLSDLDNLPDGLEILPMEVALKERPEYLKKYLGKLVDAAENGFTALNSAFMANALLICVKKNAEIASRLEILSLSTEEAGGHFLLPRTLIVAEENSKLQLVQNFASFSKTPVLNNSVTEIVVKAGARVDLYNIQRDAEHDFHIETTGVNIEKEGAFNSHCITLGGALIRNNLNIQLAESGARCSLNGLYLGHKKQHMDNHVFINHAAPQGTSTQLYKGILDDMARAVFSGKIYVKEGAQKTDATQTNKTLLLSEEAHVDTKPQLEIYADDVKCAHGAAVGQLDPDSVFYLKSRGIGEALASKLLTLGFVSEVIDQIELEPIREGLRNFLLSRLESRKATG